MSNRKDLKNKTALKKLRRLRQSSRVTTIDVARIGRKIPVVEAMKKIQVKDQRTEDDRRAGVEGLLKNIDLQNYS